MKMNYILYIEHAKALIDHFWTGVGPVELWKVATYHSKSRTIDNADFFFQRKNKSNANVAKYARRLNLRELAI